MESIENETIHTIDRYMDAQRVRRYYHKRRGKTAFQVIAAVVVYILATLLLDNEVIFLSISFVFLAGVGLFSYRKSRDKTKALDEIVLSDSIDKELYQKLEGMTDASRLDYMNRMLEANGSDKRVIIMRNDEFQYL